MCTAIVQGVILCITSNLMDDQTGEKMNFINSRITAGDQEKLYDTYYQGNQMMDDKTGNQYV